MEGDTLDWGIDDKGTLTIKKVGELVKLQKEPEEQLNLDL